MKRITMLCTFLLVIIFAAGCSDQKAPTAVLESTPDGPVSLAKTPPAMSGPFVARLQTGFLFIFIDPQRQLLSLFASDDGLLSCRTPTVFQPADVQTISSPAGPLNLLAKAQKSFAAVYDISGGFVPTCAFLLGAQKLAEGTAHVTSTDNDVLVSGTRTNTFRFKQNGQLQKPGGGTVGYNLNFHFQIKKDGSFIVLQNDIKLTP